MEESTVVEVTDKTEHAELRRAGPYPPQLPFRRRLSHVPARLVTRS
jgi:hypothetical protein